MAEVNRALEDSSTEIGRVPHGRAGEVSLINSIPELCPNGLEVDANLRIAEVHFSLKDSIIVQGSALYRHMAEIGLFGSVAERAVIKRQDSSEMAPREVYISLEPAVRKSRVEGDLSVGKVNGFGEYRILDPHTMAMNERVCELPCKYLLDEVCAEYAVFLVRGVLSEVGYLASLDLL